MSFTSPIIVSIN
ncbi:hypothetical protein D039_5234A, partial [Vibrio parahaemolyticus EKP-028]